MEEDISILLQPTATPPQRSTRGASCAFLSVGGLLLIASLAGFALRNRSLFPNYQRFFEHRAVTPALFSAGGLGGLSCATGLGIAFFGGSRAPQIDRQNPGPRETGGMGRRRNPLPPAQLNEKGITSASLPIGLPMISFAQGKNTSLENYVSACWPTLEGKEGEDYRGNRYGLNPRVVGVASGSNYADHGQPPSNADSFRYEEFEGMTSLIIANGVGSGQPSANVAWGGAKGFANGTLRAVMDDYPTTSQECATCLQGGLKQAQVEIVEASPLYGTALLGGLVLEIDPAERQKLGGATHFFTFTTIGSCKAYRITFKEGDTSPEVVDLTKGLASKDRPDRLARFCNLEGETANLSYVTAALKEGDLLLLVTDGIHDNLDPYIRGEGPGVVDLEDWDGIEDVPTEQRDQWKEDKLASLLVNSHQLTANEITSKIVDNVWYLTADLRQDMARGEYGNNNPGRLDFATCMAYRIPAPTQE